MSTPTFDIHEAVKAPTESAAADHLAIEPDLSRPEQRLSIRLGKIIVTGIGVLLVLIKLL